jgi:hypothetical protein
MAATSMEYLFYDSSLFKSSGRRPPRHIHNPGELMFFTRWSGQRIGTRFNFYRKVRPCSELHRPNTEASQIAEVHLANRILQDEGRVRDGKHIVGADSTLHHPAFLPPGRIFVESLQDTSGGAYTRVAHLRA